MSDAKRPGYIAISRGIFDHPLLKTNKRYSKLEAWAWLINAAAWRAHGHRWRFGVLHVERGELAASVREMAEQWGWPRSNVSRFLNLLAREAMIILSDSASETRTGTRTGPITQRAPSIITICNYDKFQRLVGGSKNKVGHEPGHEPGHELQQSFAIPGLLPSEPTNQSNHKNLRRSLSEIRQDQKPGHGAKGCGMVWYDYDTPEWHTYAADYQEVRGTMRLPESRVGGRGNWFRILGELKRTKRR
jgi:hypothetical protein